MCAQVRTGTTPAVLVDSPLSDTPLGIPPCEAQLALQADSVKELVNKVAWVLGSVYRQPYSSMRNPARAYAWRIVKQVLKDHGFPAKISK